MKVYNVIIHGVNLPIDDTKVLYGFFKSVRVMAWTPAVAEENAKQQIRREVKNDFGLFCDLSVDSIGEVDHIFSYFTLFSDYGYNYYPMNEETEGR